MADPATSDSRNTLSAEALMAQRDDAMRESVKGLLLINGGGVIALFAFLQGVMYDSPVFATYILGGIACMLAGLVCAGGIQYSRFQASKAHQNRDKAAHDRYYARYTNLTIGSLGAFAAGSAIVVIGTLFELF